MTMDVNAKPVMYKTPVGLLTAEQLSGADLLVDGPGWMASPERGFGLCGESGIDKNALEWHRYSRLRVNFVRQANGDLLFASGSELETFDAGFGEVGDGYPWKLNQAENDLSKTGAPVRENFQYEATATSYEIDDAYELTGTTPDDFEKQWTPAAVHYSEIIRRIIWQQGAFLLQYLDSDCNWIGGLLRSFPPASGLGGSTQTRAGAGIGVANIYPLRRRILMGARDQVDQATFGLVFPAAGLRVVQDSVLTSGDVSVDLVQHVYGRRVFACSSGCLPMPAFHMTNGAAGQAGQYGPQLARG